MANEKRLIFVDVVLAGIETFKECYEGAGLKPWVVEHIQTALQMVERFVKESPKVDAVEVVHAMWIEVDDGVLIGKGTHFECSVCKGWQSLGRLSKYCPNCGAIMDGGNEDV